MSELLFGEIKCTGAADDAKSGVARAVPLRFLEFRFDVVAVFLAFVSEDSARILPGDDDAVGGQLCGAIVFNRAIERVVAGLAGGAALSVKIAVVNDAGKLPGVAFRAAFCRASELGEPIAIEVLTCN